MIVGLTGGIGSGKSTVAKLFELLGCAVFNSDQVAKDIYFNASVKQKVTSLLGPEVYLSDTQIDKALISTRIFSNKDLLQALNAIIHPAVIHKTKLFVNAHANRLVIKESALLFEAGLEKEVDKIVVVAASEEIRIKRVMQRDGSGREEVLKKLHNQLAQEEKIKKADFVIYNNETELIIPQVINVYNSLRA